MKNWIKQWTNTLIDNYMITSKREEIRYKSGRFKAMLFPYTLLVREINYDYNF